MNLNDVTLVGKIGYNYKIAKASSGNEYVSFALEIEARENAKEYDSNYHQTIHVTCFKKPVIEYLKRIKAKQGNHAVVFGFVSSFPTEIKGKKVFVNTINAREILIAKTKSDNAINTEAQEK